MTNRIPEKLKEYQQLNSLNNKQLADLLEVSESYISRVLRGERGDAVTVKILNRIHEKLGLEPNDLLLEDSDE